MIFGRFAGAADSLKRNCSGMPPLAFISFCAIRPEHAAEMFRTLPHAQLAVLPGTGHMELTARTEWLVSMIGQFLGAPVQT